MKCMKSRSVEDVGESVRLDVQMEFSEIYVSAYTFKYERNLKNNISTIFSNVIYYVVASQRNWHLCRGNTET